MGNPEIQIQRWIVFPGFLYNRKLRFVLKILRTKMGEMIVVQMRK